MGSIIRCFQPVVDYGLVKVNTTEDYEIEIQNESPIVADLLIKNAANKMMDFSNFIDSESCIEKDIDRECLIYDKPLLTKKSNSLMMDQYLLKL